MTTSITQKSVFATLPRMVRGQSTVLKGDPKGKNFLYTNGNSVIIRDIENPAIADVYTQHAKEATVAAYAPSGFYIASGDVSGKLRIWDTTQKEHLLKYEYQSLSGRIKDIAWSPDSKRAVVVGEGREQFANVFLWDSGSSVGKITGHSGSINSVDWKQTRPYRICTASEDSDVGFFEGPPFKYHHLNKSHTNFVNCVRYAPDGELFASGGADGQVFLYNGKTGEETCTLGGGRAHPGGIYAMSWSPDSKFLLTASGDKTAKLWDIEANAAVTQFTFGKNIEDQQLACLWQGDYMLTVSLSGNINYLDRNNPDKPLRILKGHNKNIISLAVSDDKSKIFTGSFDGRINSWDPSTGAAETFTGQGHKNQVTAMGVSGDQLVTCSMDDTVRYTSMETLEYGASGVGLSSMPKGIGVGKDGLAIVACINEVAVVRNGAVVSTLKVDYEPCSAAVHPGQTEAAVGGGTDGKLHIFTLDNDTLTEKTTISMMCEAVLDVAYSPDGAYVACCTNARGVLAYHTTDYKLLTDEWTGHNSRVNCVAWSPDSRHLASGSLDTNLFSWSVENFKKKNTVKGAHAQCNITGVAWLDNNTLVSVSHDCCLKIWDVVHQ